MRSSGKGTRLIGASLAVALMFGAVVAAPAMAEDFSQDFGIIKACAGDVWRLCSDVLPDVGRMKACMQNKMGQLPKACLDKLLDAMAGSTFKVCKDQTTRSARRRAAMCMMGSPIVSAKRSAATAQPPSDGQGRDAARSTPRALITNTGET